MRTLSGRPGRVQAGPRPGGSATLPASACSRPGPGRPQAGWLGHPAGLQPTPGRVQAGPRPAASGSPRPPASPPGRGQAGSRPGGSATLPAQGQPRPGSGRPPCGWPDLPGRPGRPQAGLRLATLHLKNASNGSIFWEGVFIPLHLPPAS